MMRLFLQIFVITITSCTFLLQALSAPAAAKNGPALPYPASLLQDLKSGDEATRLSAIQIIKPYRETGSLPLLLSLVLEDPSSQVRLQAVGALWNRGDAKAVKVLERVLMLDKDNDVRIASAGALGDIGFKSTSNLFLVNTIQSARDHVLIARCLRSLGKLQDHSSAGTLASPGQPEPRIS